MSFLFEMWPRDHDLHSVRRLARTDRSLRGIVCLVLEFKDFNSD